MNKLEIPNNLRSEISGAIITLEVGDTKEMLMLSSRLMDKIYYPVKRNMTKYINDKSHELFFTSEDLVLLGGLSESALKKYQAQIGVDFMIAEAKRQMEEAGDINELNKSCAENMKIIASLTQFNSAISYMATLLHLLEIEYQQGELGNVLLECIREHLRK